MSESRGTTGWEAPSEPAGPGPGVQFAPYGDRLVAYILDGIIIGVFVIVATVIAAIVLGTGLSGTRENPTVSPAAAGGFVAIIVVVIVIATAYFPWFWLRGGATPGMKRFRLRVVRDSDGGRITGGAAVLRFIGMWVSSAVSRQETWAGHKPVPGLGRRSVKTRGAGPSATRGALVKRGREACDE